MEKIGYGLIGFGGIAENRIGRDPRRKEAAEALGVRWYAWPEELLRDPAVQAVVIATSNGGHLACHASARGGGSRVAIRPAADAR